MQPLEQREGYARGWVVLSDHITYDSAIVFPSKAEALAFLQDKNIPMSSVSLRPLMASKDVHWL